MQTRLYTCAWCGLHNFLYIYRIVIPTVIDTTDMVTDPSPISISTLTTIPNTVVIVTDVIINVIDIIAFWFIAFNGELGFSIHCEIEACFSRIRLIVEVINCMDNRILLVQKCLPGFP